MGLREKRSGTKGKNSFRGEKTSDRCISIKLFGCDDILWRLFIRFADLQCDSRRVSSDCEYLRNGYFVISAKL